MTQDAPQPRPAAGLSVAGWPLRRKLALALAIPLLLAATLGGLRVQNDLVEAGNAAASAKQVTILAPAVDYLRAAETAMVAAQGTSTISQGTLIDALGQINANAEKLQDAVDDAELNGRQSAQVNALLDLSQAMRGEEADKLGPATWIAQVRQLESGVSQLASAVNAAQATPEPRLDQLAQALTGRLALTMQQSLINRDDVAQSDNQELFSELGVEASAIDRLAGSVGDNFPKEVAELRTTNTANTGLVKDNVAMDLGGQQSYIPYDIITDELLKDVEADLKAAAADARQSALTGALITLAALAAAVALAALVARSLLGPIGRVRDGALAVARQTLPDAVARIRAGAEPEPVKPLDVTTNEEIGQVARAVDDLHRQAIHLASGEAQLRQTVNAMFVTLSRRSNSLVNQQLAQIERLEQDEEDPKRLESLFRLDHLASRMRRTADSLLILADAPNKAAGQFSLTVGEALQAATSGVQDYQRVQIMSHLGTRISEDAAADVVHLLTELVDNALTFSPPTEPVRLNATLGADGVTLTVTDAGLGVPAKELEAFNHDLAGDVEATPETARRMGLFVVSRLAERHGITARLAKNPGGGLTATVVMPPAILPELPQPARPARTAVPVGAVPSASPREVLSSGPAKVVVKEAAATGRGARTKSRRDKAAEKAAQKAAQRATARADKDAAKEAARQKAAAEKAVADKVAAAKAAADKAAAEKAAAEKAAAAKASERANTDKAAADKAAAEKAAAEKAAADKAAAERAAAEKSSSLQAATASTDPVPDLTPGEGDPDRPPLGTLLPRREPGANMPKTGADAFLPPETSAASGPLFGKRSTPARPAEPTDGAPVAPKVASVVPITALAARQRAQAEEEARTQEALAGATNDAAAEAAPEVVTEAAPEIAPEAAPQAPASAAATEVVGKRKAQPSPAEPVQAGGLPVRTPGESPEINRDMPGVPSTEPTRDPLGVDTPAARVDVAVAAPAPTESVNGDAPIFKSMRSGFLASDDTERDWQKTDLDRGWEIAEHVAEEVPVTASTSVGLPMRQPGERLVPGGVAAPTGAKVRDPEAIRRRLQSHTAGVSRGRRAATTTSRHTEAGPA